MSHLEKYLDKLEDTHIIAWIIKNQIKNERGQPIKFDWHSFMIDPYLDWSPLQGVRKASQCGWSVMTNLKLLYSAKFGIPEYGIPAANVIYTLPSDADVNSFVPSKTNLLIKNNPVIIDYMRSGDGAKVDVDSIQRKKIGNSMVYFKGTRSKTAALMLSADLNIHDESDRSEKSIVDEYESRLANSLYKGRWIFSNPSAPNMPADLMFLDSDQKYWFIKCPRCGHWQYLDWFKLSEYTFKKAIHCYIDDTYWAYVCGNCAQMIPDEARRRGKWVKKYQDKQVSGYWVTHFMYPWIQCREVGNVERTKPKAYFQNFVRGVPYVGSDVIVDSRVIVNNIVLDKRDWVKGQVAMGVDNGDVKHYVIGDKEGVFEYGKTKSWDDIERLIEKYEPFTVIDQNPYPNKPRELAAKYRPAQGKRWRVYLSYYILQSKNYELIEWGIGEKEHMVYPVRDLLFDDLVAYISNGNMKFFNPKSYWEEYISHWETMYRGDFIGQRRLSEVSMGVPQKEARGVWLSSTGEDHYCHATLYYYVALSKIIAGQGRVISQGGTVSNVVREAEPKRIITVPEVIHDTMKPVRSFIPDLSQFRKQKQGSGSVADAKK